MVADTLQSYFLKRNINLQMCHFFMSQKVRNNTLELIKLKALKKRVRNFI